MVADGEHVVQFYDRDADLVRAVGDYLTRAISEGEAAIVIATEAHRRAFEADMAAGGIDVARAVVDGSLVWLDPREVRA
jgi:KaiC/GvpD/RAD55 family RecA-like ATPase